MFIIPCCQTSLYIGADMAQQTTHVKNENKMQGKVDGKQLQHVKYSKVLAGSLFDSWGLNLGCAV